MFGKYRKSNKNSFNNGYAFIRTLTSIQCTKYRNAENLNNRNEIVSADDEFSVSSLVFRRRIAASVPFQRAAPTYRSNLKAVPARSFFRLALGRIVARKIIKATHRMAPTVTATRVAAFKNFAARLLLLMALGAKCLSRLGGFSHGKRFKRHRYLLFR